MRWLLACAAAFALMGTFAAHIVIVSAGREGSVIYATAAVNTFTPFSWVGFLVFIVFPIGSLVALVVLWLLCERFPTVFPRGIKWGQHLPQVFSCFF